jgi:glycosyltransferase involved in cell wall biosynthesis
MSSLGITDVLRKAGRLLPKRIRAEIKQSRVVRNLIRKAEDSRISDDLSFTDASGWTRLEDCPAPLLDPGGAKIGNLIYVVCGFEDMATVSKEIHIFDMSRKVWRDSIPVPDDLPNSHSAVSTDGTRYIYIAGGQLGGNCRPAIPQVYCLDTQAGTWHQLPPLPQPRYAGSMQLWRGRLHYVGGADADRWTPTTDHWSLGVSGTDAIEPTWRSETPIPVGGMHRASALVEDRFYVLGGQQGDFKAIEGDPQYTCTGKTRETYLQSAFRLSDPNGTWDRIADMPIAVSHCDFSCLVLGGTLYLYGGQTFKHPEDFYLRLTDAIQAYDTETDRWSIAGYLPCYLKMPVLAEFGDEVFITVGQRGKGDTDRPGRISAMTWATAAPRNDTCRYPATLPALGGKDILLVSHALSRSGAPLELLELARAMIQSGANVRAVTLSDDARSGNVSTEFKVPVVPFETAVHHAAQADLIIANTTNYRVKDWVEARLEHTPKMADKILWAVHEIDVETYKPAAEILPRVKATIFGSSACLKAWSDICEVSTGSHVVHPGLEEEVFERGMQEKHLFQAASPTARTRTPQLLSRAQIRAELGVDEDDFLLLSVGGYSRRKGQKQLLETLIRAVRERRLPLKLALAGFHSYDERDELLKAGGSDGLNVLDPRRSYLFTPHVDALYLASDAHVINAQGDDGRGETFGRATVHGMAFGLPVLGTRAGGTLEIIEDGVSGFLYPVGQAGQDVLIDHVERLYRDSDLKEKMGAAGRSRAHSRFRKEIYLQKMDAVISSVLS